MCCVVHHGSLGCDASLLPFLIPKFVPSWFAAAYPDITSDQMTLIDRDMQGGTILILDPKLFSSFLAVNKSDKFPNAVIGMNDEVAFVEFVNSSNCSRMALMREFFFSTGSR